MPSFIVCVPVCFVNACAGATHSRAATTMSRTRLTASSVQEYRPPTIATMSDTRPIGVFDSGVGGLTVLHECLVTMPHEDFVYLGDHARLPYGPRAATKCAGSRTRSGLSRAQG